LSAAQTANDFLPYLGMPSNIVRGHARQIQAALRRIAVVTTQTVRIDGRPQRGRFAAGRPAGEREGGGQNQNDRLMLHHHCVCRAGSWRILRALGAASMLNLLAVEGCRQRYSSFVWTRIRQLLAGVPDNPDVDLPGRFELLQGLLPMIRRREPVATPKQ